MPHLLYLRGSLVHQGFHVNLPPEMEIQWCQVQVSEGAKLLGLHVQSVSKGVIQRETIEDLVARIQVAAGVIRYMPGIFPRVRHDIIRQYTKCVEVGGGDIEHLLQVNKMVFSDSISIVSFTSFLAFVVQTAFVFLHISETLARK